MAENSNGAEQTEEATPKRLEDAKKKGQVARSKELGTFASLVGSAIGLLIMGPGIIEGIKTMLISSLNFSSTRAFDQHAISLQLLSTTKDILMLLGPFFALMTALTVLSPLVMGGWLFSGDALLPKFERINPAKGLARTFSVKSLVELVKAIAKFLLVATVVIVILRTVLHDIIRLPLLDTEISLSAAGTLLLKCFLGFSSVLLVVVAIDVPYQIWDHARQLKMTKQEIRDEMKETEGKPEVKSAIRAKQQEIANRRMMEEVPKADVIITNPTHYAVAIRYDQQGGGAPIVVAKGKDHIAAKIREIAKENGIVLFRAPPLARALYATTELNEEIPENLFVAVAQVLAYIFQLRQAAAGATRVIPHPPGNISVPEEYTRKEQN